MNSISLVNISKFCSLPDGIVAEIQLTSENNVDFNGFFERVSFLNQLDQKALTILKMESGKPFIKLGKKHLGYSISHTADTYLVAINRDGEIGVDIEKSERKVHPKLRQRILNDLESQDDSISTLQLWTIKEAVLKLTGTGLRTNMNKVVVHRVDEINFTVHHDNKEISIVSLSADGFWISVAWTLTS